MNAVIQKKLRRITKDTYREYYKKLNNTAPLKNIYHNLLDKYETISPVHRTYESPSFAKEMETYDNIVIVANHLPTPHLISIDDDTFFDEVNLSRRDLVHFAYDPNEFRHYPIVNTVATTHKTHIITTEKPNILGTILSRCGHIIIPTVYSGKRTTYLVSKIRQRMRLNNKNAFIIFPEGRDTEGFLDQYNYYMFDLKTGFAVISKKLGLPILPISVSFDMENFEYHCIIHNVITPDEVAQNTVLKLTKRLKQTFTRGIPKALPKVSVIWISEQNQ